MFNNEIRYRKCNPLCRKSSGRFSPAVFHYRREVIRSFNLVAGAVTEPFAEMVWVSTGGDWETINHLTDIFVTMNTATDCGKLVEILCGRQIKNMDKLYDNWQSRYDVIILNVDKINCGDVRHFSDLLPEQPPLLPRRLDSRPKGFKTGAILNVSYIVSTIYIVYFTF